MHKRNNTVLLKRGLSAACLLIICIMIGVLFTGGQGQKEHTAGDPVSMVFAGDTLYRIPCIWVSSH